MPSLIPPAQSHWTPTLHLSVNREDKAPGHVTNDTSSGSWVSGLPNWAAGGSSEDPNHSDHPKDAAATTHEHDATPYIKSGAFGTRVNESDWIRNGGFPSSTSRKASEGISLGGLTSWFTGAGRKAESKPVAVASPPQHVPHSQDAEIASAVNLTPPIPTNSARSGKAKIVCTAQLDDYERCLVANDGSAPLCDAPWETFVTCQDRMQQSLPKQ